MARLGDFITQIRGVSYKPEDVYDFCSEDTVPLLRAGNIQDGRIDFNDIIYVSKNRVSPSQYLKKGDIIICSSSGSKNVVGKAAIVEDDLPYTFGAFCKVVRTQTIKKSYLGHFFQSHRYRNTISELAAGANINNIRNEHIDDLPIPLYNDEEQLYISSLLDKATDILFAHKQQITKLDALIKSRFVEMFGDTIMNPYSWEKSALGAVCDVRDGTHESPSYHEEGYPLVTSRNLASGKIDFSDCNLICEDDLMAINKRSKADYGDILMPMIGTVGNPVIVDTHEEFAIKNVALIKFYNNTRVTNTYVSSLLKSDYFDKVVMGKVRGGTQKFISLSDIRTLTVLVPPIDLQNQFAAFVSQVEKSKAAVHSTLDKARLLFDSLMQKYFG